MKTIKMSTAEKKNVLMKPPVMFVDVVFVSIYDQSVKNSECKFSNPQ